MKPYKDYRPGNRYYQEDYPPCFASRLEQLLIENNKSNNWLSKKIYRSNQYISYWLSQERTPKMEDIINICKLFDVSADWLLGLKEDRK